MDLINDHHLYLNYIRDEMEHELLAHNSYFILIKDNITVSVLKHIKARLLPFEKQINSIISEYAMSIHMDYNRLRSFLALNCGVRFTYDNMC
jgi:hypothetical protein